MTNVHQNTDVMVLSAAHSLMVSNVPEVVIDAHSLSETSTRVLSTSVKTLRSHWKVWYVGRHFECQPVHARSNSRNVKAKGQ